MRRAWRALNRARTFRRCRRLPPGGKLHVACGGVRLEGWINIDRSASTAADWVVDVRYGLPFRDLDFIFAEHFIEHLSFTENAGFLRECRRTLRPSGVLRLATPNLDWVHRSHYAPSEYGAGEHALEECFALNKAFYGWGHRFLFNGPALAAALHDAGFDGIRTVERGRSRHPALVGLEHHETFPDLPGIAHLLIVEANGVRTAGGESSIKGPAEDFLRACSAR